MRVQDKKKQAWLRFLTTFLLCIAFISLTFGITYSRYEASLSKTFALQYEAQSGHIYIRSVEKNDSEIPENQSVVGETAATEEIENSESNDVLENAYAVEFIISNGSDKENYCTYDQEATLSLFATIGLGNPENFIITLADGNTTYLASCSEVVKGTELYTTYGPGWMYHFYDAEGNEITWAFPGTQLIERQMKIIILGSSEMPAAMNLIVGAQPSEG